MVTLSVVAAIVAIALPNWNANRLNIITARQMLLADLRLARVSAITKSIHYQVSFPSDMRHITLSGMRQSPAGSGNWVVDPTKVQTTTLPASTQVAATSLNANIEFTTRGMVANSSTLIQLSLSDSFGNTKSLQVWPSGQINAT